MMPHKNHPKNIKNQNRINPIQKILFHLLCFALYFSLFFAFSSSDNISKLKSTSLNKYSKNYLTKPTVLKKSFPSTLPKVPSLASFSPKCFSLGRESLYNNTGTGSEEWVFILQGVE